MSLISTLFPKKSVDEATLGYFKTLSGYTPVFRNFGAGIYEAELCRSAINAIATHSSKLKPVIRGARSDLQKIIEYQPNEYMTTSQFLYKVATILEAENTVFIVPIYDKWYQRIVGIYPVQPREAEIRERGGQKYVVFKFANNTRQAIEFEKVGILNKFFYKREFFGENNNALRPTLDMLYTQQQGIMEGIKQGASIRFIGKLAQALKPSDIELERKRWVQSNLSLDNSNGIALFDTKYSDVKQVTPSPYIISNSQIQTVYNSVYSYFGVNEKILQNSYTPNEWAAFYEGKIEPFALQLSLVLTNMFFTPEQRTRGNQILFTSNRLQYATNAEKLSVSKDLLDRGTLTINEVREIFNLSPVEGGDAFIIRGEYYDASEKLSGINEDDGGASE